jgi:hypothetical protein
LLGTPQKGIQYLVTSVSHPKLLDALTGFDVKLWHVYDGTRLRELPAIYPRGELIVTGGSNVGLRAMTLARVLGYTDLHIYGMDYSFPKPTGELRQHAEKHPNPNKNVITVKIGRRTFYSTPVMVFYAREFWHEIKQLNDTRFTLNGDGLLQAWGTSKIIEREDVETAKQSVIATKSPEVISPAYREQNRLLHEKVLEFGDRGAKLAELVQKIRKASDCD